MVRLKQTTTKTEKFSFKISNILSRKFPTFFSGFVCINLKFYLSKLAALPSSVWVGINNVCYSESDWKCFDIITISTHNVVGVKRKISKLGFLGGINPFYAYYTCFLGALKNSHVKNFATFSRTIERMLHSSYTHSVIRKTSKFHYVLSTKLTNWYCFQSWQLSSWYVIRNCLNYLRQRKHRKSVNTFWVEKKAL